MNEWLADNLLTAMRDSGMLPPAAERASTTRLLGIMNREQRLYLTKFMLAAREAYNVVSEDIAVTQGVSSYPIPSKAVGAKLKLVETVDGSGAAIPLKGRQYGDVYTATMMGVPPDYYLQGNSIVLTTSPTASSTLRVKYFRRMNKIVASDAAGEITAFNAGAKTVTVSAPPSTFAASATRYDFIQGQPHFDVSGVNQSATCAAGVLTFSTSLPSGLAVGDYVALTGETPIVNAPVEVQYLLVTRSLFVYLRAVGDQKAEALKADLLEQEKSAMSLIAPRVEDESRPLVNYNAPGWSRQVGITRRRAS